MGFFEFRLSREEWEGTGCLPICLNKRPTKAILSITKANSAPLHLPSQLPMPAALYKAETYKWMFFQL